ncbi:MAG: prepilin-type N-terminal cleavage/methylation domain-containing protein [Planctomycetaceae bacterium]|nr:prepilin-type N-terminal cleavage/methylation domain-containing protein [Planctomycetaceae bacterium]
MKTPTKPATLSGRCDPDRNLHLAPRKAFTLLETIIAIGLVSLLMAGIYSAMQIYYRLQVDSHDDIERVQIARVLLRQITRDIQSVVFEEQDSISEEESLDESEEATVVDLESSMTSYTNGLVGTETDLLLYINRPDRELNYVSSQELVSFSDRSSDLMIVRYFIAQSGMGGISSQIADQYSTGNSSDPVGLVRMAGDLYGLSTAIQEGDENGQISAAKLLAPEASAIRFQYFDGLTWQTEWDSNQLNSMPIAIEITLTLITANDQDDVASKPDDPYAAGPTTHRMVVAVPVAEPFVAEAGL